MSRWLTVNEIRLWPFLQARTPRTIHYLYPENTLINGWKWKKHHRLILSCHQPVSYLKERRSSIQAGFFKGLERADVIVVLSPTEISPYKSIAPHADVRFIPHGIDTDFFRPATRNPQRKLILTVGNWLRDYRMWAEVVRTVTKTAPDAEFAVLASTTTITDARQELGPSSARVSWLSNVSDLELLALYHRAAIAFLPLKAAVANNGVLEAMATAVPVVASRLPSVEAYLGSHGCFFENSDSNEASSMILEILGNKQERFRVGQLLRERAESEFAWPKIASNYTALY